MMRRRSDDARFGARGFAIGGGREAWDELFPFFRPSEFRDPGIMDRAFLLRLREARRLTAAARGAPAGGVPFVIVSSYRSAEANEDAAGRDNSAHVERPCAAVDLRVRSSLERWIVVACLLRVGFERLVLESPTAWQRKQWGPSSGTVHVDDSVRLPRPVLALEWRR